MMKKRDQTSRRLTLRSVALPILLALFPFILFTSGCAPAEKKVGKTALCSVFPVYDWMRELTAGVADGVRPSLLNKNGADMHSYQPSAADIVNIAGSDLFVCIGGFSDSWIGDIPTSMNTSQLRVSLYAELFGEDAERESVEHESEEHRGEDSPLHDHTDDGHGGYNGTVPAPSLPDEHIWLSLKNAVRSCEILTEKLCAVDPENSSAYRKNCDSYTEKLKTLSDEYESAANESDCRSILFADRFPFSGLMQDCGISVYSAFSGCSSETDAGYDTIARLAEALHTTGLRGVTVTESSDKRLAETVIKTCNDPDRRIFVLDSMQSVTEKQVLEGKTYLGTARENLSVFKEAINKCQ